MAQPVVHASRYYRELENGDSVLAVCRPEDQLWHAEHVRADGWVVEWAYGPSLESALGSLLKSEDEATGAADQDAKTAVVVEIGTRLREARTRLGLEPADVEAATMIPMRHLLALELERFERLPEGIYRRSFLREYADFLGLDGRLYADEYERRFAPPQSEPDIPGRPPGVALDSLRRALSPTALFTALVVALIGFGIYGMLTAGSTSPAPPGVAASPPMTKTPHVTVPAPAAPRPQAAVAVRPPAALTLTAVRGRCWLLVQRGSSAGPLVYTGTLEQGQAVRFGLRHPLWIRLGAPRSLEATIAGRSLILPTLTANVVVTRAGIQPAA